ncbi:hypothetical protein M5K25_018707 [Dendrobium thyrsiflorum]|uniref:Uncharacterized protein n=1 Tax=Dendrobium thyrsiflorum TaxID=117978 RepID=A0ABD0UIS0_DENTH
MILKEDVESMKRGRSIIKPRAQSTPFKKKENKVMLPGKMQNITCLSSSSATSSNRSFGVEPEVFDATARPNLPHTLPPCPTSPHRPPPPPPLPFNSPIRPPSCMANPNVDHGFVEDSQGYVDRIIFTLAQSIEEHLPTGSWMIVGRPPIHLSPATFPSTKILGSSFLVVISFLV